MEYFKKLFTVGPDTVFVWSGAALALAFSDAFDGAYFAAACYGLLYLCLSIAAYNWAKKKGWDI